MSFKRPKINSEEFDYAINKASLSDTEYQIIEYIRFFGTFNQPCLVRDLNLKSKPPALSILCNACRQVGVLIPDHFKAIREWSELISEDGVRWDGNLICATAYNIDGKKLIPELKNCQFHNFAVHYELFNGLD